MFEKWKKEEDTAAKALSPAVKPSNARSPIIDKSHIYRITQQEIVFYMKNRDGVIKIVYRPLVESKRATSRQHAVQGLEEDWHLASLNRHKSTPNLHSTHIVR